MLLAPGGRSQGAANHPTLPRTGPTTARTNVSSAKKPCWLHHILYAKALPFEGTPARATSVTQVASPSHHQATSHPNSSLFLFPQYSLFKRLPFRVCFDIGPRVTHRVLEGEKALRYHRVRALSPHSRSERDQLVACGPQRDRPREPAVGWRDSRRGRPHRGSAHRASGVREAGRRGNRAAGPGRPPGGSAGRRAGVLAGTSVASSPSGVLSDRSAESCEPGGRRAT